MKKSIAVFTAVVILTVSGLALAQMNDKSKEIKADKTDMMGSKGGMMGMMGGKGMMGRMQHGMMMKMMGKSVVATSDGGIVIVSANKMSKYDKDLNLVKEVELKTDMGCTRKMMAGMMANCPMMGRGKMGAIKGQPDTSKAADTSDAPSDADHIEHHQ